MRVQLQRGGGHHAEAGLDTRYYTPEIHAGAFALPPFVAAQLLSLPEAQLN